MSSQIDSEEYMTDAQFLTKMHSLISDGKWDDYVTEWADAEYDKQVVCETDEFAVLVFEHPQNWTQYYGIGHDAQVVMEQKAESITGDTFRNTYPVVVPKGDQRSDSSN